MFIEERHRKILETLKSKGRISVEEIRAEFEVSAESARRDLRLMEEQGLLKRTHGGAISQRQVAGPGRPKNHTVREMQKVLPNYMAIAKKALTLIHENDVVFLAGSSIGYFMAQNIPELPLTVVTNTLDIAEVLRTKETIRVLFCGGELNDKGSCFGDFTLDMIRRLRFDCAFITSASISARFGLSIQLGYWPGILNAVMDSAKKTVGLFPTEKIGFESVRKICGADRLDVLITDWDAPEEELRLFDELEIDVIIAANEP
jgi:DeoR/GlpR family transcriptional regulator of sugar metabolism